VLAAGAVLAGRELLMDAGRTEVASAERVVTVPRGERARFRLSDGTEVLLGPGSTLRHPSTFGSASREVTLEGEAYFTVEHDERRPFRVRAGNLIATDLGTEFLVRAYPEVVGARVVVRSGTVAVRSVQASDSVGPGRVVRPGELGRIGADGVSRVEPADTAAYFAWTTGTLVFDGTPLREALPQLSRWYDLDFRLADSSLAGIPLSGRLDQTLTPARLDLLAGSVGLEQVRRGRIVTFYRAGAAPR
jgi:transmembrane sensor